MGLLLTIPESGVIESGTEQHSLRFHETSHLHQKSLCLVLLTLSKCPKAWWNRSLFITVSSKIQSLPQNTCRLILTWAAHFSTTKVLKPGIHLQYSGWNRSPLTVVPSKILIQDFYKLTTVELVENIYLTGSGLLITTKDLRMLLASLKSCWWMTYFILISSYFHCSSVTTNISFHFRLVKTLFWSHHDL